MAARSLHSRISSHAGLVLPLAVIAAYLTCIGFEVAFRIDDAMQQVVVLRIIHKVSTFVLIIFPAIFLAVAIHQYMFPTQNKAVTPRRPHVPQRSGMAMTRNLKTPMLGKPVIMYGSLFRRPQRESLRIPGESRQEEASRAR